MASADAKTGTLRSAVVSFEIPLWFFCLAHTDVARDNNASTLLLDVEKPCPPIFEMF